MKGSSAYHAVGLQRGFTAKLATEVANQARLRNRSISTSEEQLENTCGKSTNSRHSFTLVTSSSSSEIVKPFRSSQRSLKETSSNPPSVTCFSLPHRKSLRRTPLFFRKLSQGKKQFNNNNNTANVVIDDPKFLKTKEQLRKEIILSVSRIYPEDEKVQFAASALL